MFTMIDEPERCSMTDHDNSSRRTFRSCKWRNRLFLADKEEKTRKCGVCNAFG